MLSLVLLVISVLGVISHATPLVARATLTQVTNFGTNPAGIRMYIYVPDSVASSPGIVVSLHGASGNAQQQYQSTPYARLADQYGFIAVYPESPQGAWDATSSQSLVHEGGGASQSIANMAKYIISTYRANANKVFVSGISSGGTMANTMAGTYPDVFKGAIIYSAGSSGNIRNMYPGYTGSYSKIQLYLGSQDTIIGSSAFNTTLAAWAPVLGYDTTPDQVLPNTPARSWTTYVLGSKLEGIWAEGVGYPVPTQGDEDMKWWGFAGRMVSLKTQNGTGRSQPYIIREEPLGSTRRLRIATIGAGISGLNMIRTLRKSMTDYDHVVYEKNSDVGGTWYENRYPGCQCDHPSHNYQFTWRPNPRWSQFSACADEIQRYILDLCDDEDMRREIKTSHQVVGARWKPDISQWILHVKNLVTGEILEDHCHFLLNATVILKYDRLSLGPGQLPLTCGSAIGSGQISQVSRTLLETLYVTAMPNYFVFMGPNAPIGHGSVLSIAEQVARYIVRMLTKCQVEGIKTVMPKADAVREFAEHAHAFLPRTIWAGNCRSWYKNGTVDGPITALHPGSRIHWFHMMEIFRPEDSEYEYYDKSNRFQFLGNGFSVRENGDNPTWYLDSLSDFSAI